MRVESRLSKDQANRAVWVLFGLLVVGGLVLGALRRRFQRSIDARLDALEAASSPRDGQYHPTDVATLPDPVRRYFRTALEPGQGYTTSVRLRQSGSFRLGDVASPWRPMEATQHYSTSAPGFVWDASIEVLPWIRARVVDSYVDGDGTLDARVLSALQVAAAGPDSALNEGELLRYLAEAVWFPTALLPASGVAWEAVDETSARATLSHRGQTVSAVFHFGADGLVQRVTADRYREAVDDYAPWTGSFRAYERRNGRLVPTEAAVEWTLPDGALPYWRATIADIDHRCEEVD